MLISCNPHDGNFWNFFSFLKFGTCTRNGNFGAFLSEKHNQWTLGISSYQLMWKLSRMEWQ